MAKQVTHANQFRDPRQYSIGPDRLLFVLVCDDGAIYEFQKMTDGNLWSLRARGEKSKTRDKWTQRRAPLPKNVVEVLNEHLGKKKWNK